jgi:hypothetical protein
MKIWLSTGCNLADIVFARARNEISTLKRWAKLSLKYLEQGLSALKF